MFYSKLANGFYSPEINGDSMPADVVEITAEEHAALLEGQSQGKVIDFNEDGFPILIDPVITPEQIVSIERAWRDSELIRSDIELYKVQDSDPKAVGTVAGWREYRKALRAWPEHEDFPNKEKRPVAPDA